MSAPFKVLQVLVALGIYDVWLVRPRRATRWRGGAANSLSQEFAVYGLPRWFMWTVGTLKLGSATLLLAGLRYPAVTRPAAVTLAALMAGAVSMHVKVKDPLERSLPALAMLGLSLLVAGTSPRSAGARRGRWLPGLRARRRPRVVRIQAGPARTRPLAASTSHTC